MRVIYTWKVKVGREQEFIEAWEKLTKAIRAKRKGALGSLLMRNQDDREKFVAFARWETTKDWLASNEAEPADIEASRAMRKVATLVHTEPLHEIKNLLNQE